MAVVVTPESFAMVDFDHAALVDAVVELVDRLGAGDIDLRVEVDERSPLGRSEVTSLDPVVIAVDGGAIEDPKRPRQLAGHRVDDVIGRQLLQAQDRLDPEVGGPGLDDEVPVAHQVAWDVHAVGRLSRHLAATGHDPQRQRRLYHFRNRHGFTDAADTAFARLWDADRLTWAQITTTSDEVHSAPHPA